MNEEKECGKELIHPYRGYRIFTFCGKSMDYRLTDGLYSIVGTYFNAGISNYQCINDNVGEYCSTYNGDDGICVMVYTISMMYSDLRENCDVQR